MSTPYTPPDPAAFPSPFTREEWFGLFASAAFTASTLQEELGEEDAKEHPGFAMAIIAADAVKRQLGPELFKQMRDLFERLAEQERAWQKADENSQPSQPSP